MDKRFFLAMVLSLLVLMAYSAILPKSQPLVNKDVIANSTAETVSPSKVETATASPTEDKKLILPNKLQENNLYKVFTNNSIFSFSRSGGFLVDVFDKKIDATIDIKNIGFVKEWSSYLFAMNELPRGVEFTYSEADGTEIKKIYRIKDDDSIELTISQSNITTSNIKGYDIFAGVFGPQKVADPMSERYREAFSEIKGIIQRKPVYGLKNVYEFNGKALLMGLRDKYFCSVFSPQLVVNKSFAESVDKNQVFVIQVSGRQMPGGSATIEDMYKIYVGPQDENRLKEFSPGAEKIVNYGAFDPISKVMLSVLKFCHKIFNNWGWSIIVMTILIYFLLFPLSMKSMMSMKKLQALQPKIEELKQKCKDNPQKLQLETIELYKREKVNPFGGCLPMLLQIPVFFALYQALMRFIDLKGAHFLWIKDLSAPDRMIILNNPLPVIGNEINILPLLMAITMFFQQKLSSASQNISPQAAEQQKMMSIIMPILFGFLFYKMPSGLVLYWFLNSILMVIFQWKLTKA